MVKPRASRLHSLRLFFHHTGMPVLTILVMTWLVGGITLLAPRPPLNPDDLCDIFREQPSWYDHARDSESRWGTPISTQMAFVYYESSFRSHVRPPRRLLFGFIPWTRSSTAYGYAQALDPAWGEYMEDAAGHFAQRSHMKHALDFIGWYNHRTHDRLGIGLDNPRHLYLAYHEGRTGYRRGSYRHKPPVEALATRIAARANTYANQLAQCEQEFQCRRFYQFWPFCG